MAFVQATGNSVPVTTHLAMAFGSNVGANSTLVVGISYDSTGGITTSSIADTLGNTYTLIESVLDGSGEFLAYYVAKSPSGGANIVTVTLSSAPGDGTIIIAEFSGRNTTSPIGAHAQNQQPNPGTVTDAVTVGPVTAVAGDDVVSFHVDVGAIQTGTFSAGTGFTLRKQNGAGAGQLDSMLQSHDNVSAGSISATATQANDDSTVSFVVCLLSGGGGGSTITERRTSSPLGTRAGSRQALSW